MITVFVHRDGRTSRAEGIEPGFRTFLGKFHRIVDYAVHFKLDLVEPRLGQPRLTEQLAAEILDRVALQPDALLALGAILRRVGHRMATEAVGDRLDQ